MFKASWSYFVIPKLAKKKKKEKNNYDNKFDVDTSVANESDKENNMFENLVRCYIFDGINFEQTNTNGI